MIVACLTYPLTLVGTQANLHVEQTSMVTRVHMEGFYRQISHSVIYSRWSLTRRGKKHGAMAVSSKILRPYLPAPTDDPPPKVEREMLEVDVNKMNDWITWYMHATCFIILFQRDPAQRVHGFVVLRSCSRATLGNGRKSEPPETARLCWRPTL